MFSENFGNYNLTQTRLLFLVRLLVWGPFVEKLKLPVVENERQSLMSE